MATIDDRFDRLEKMMLTGFQKQREDLRSEMRAGFQAINQRFDTVAADDAEFRRDFRARTEMMARSVRLRHPGYFKMGDRLSGLELRVDRLENARLRPQGQL